MKKSVLVTTGLSLAALTALVFAPPEADSAPRKKRLLDVSLQRVSTFANGGEGTAEISAYDKKSRRLFVVNAVQNRVDVISMRDAANPTLETSLDMSPYGGGVNSVAVSKKRVLAVAVQADTKQDPGRVVFVDAKTLEILSDVEVGALPDMVAFTPNGKTCVCANEGEPSDDYTNDPEGSVSIIKMKSNARKVTQAHVTNVDLSVFNGAALPPSVRIFGPGATVAQDLEPEYIAFDKKGKVAYVSCQENNALLVVDLKTGVATDLLGLGFKQWGVRGVTLDTYSLAAAVAAEGPLGTTGANQEIELGGFSGLFFEGVNPTTGALQFITHPDRGPNGDSADLDDDLLDERPFPLPDFQAEWVRFEVDTSTGEVAITGRVPLFREDGTTPITGLPNVGGLDEEPVDVFGNALPLDTFGADMEGILRAPDGTYWMCDEYRPALYNFDANGKLIERFVPVGSGPATGTEALPPELNERRRNRGFEGLAWFDGKVYGFVQSPMDTSLSGGGTERGGFTRIVEFDPTSKTTTGQWLYAIDGDGSDKIGDAVASPFGDFFLIERDSSVEFDAKKMIYRVNLSGATNLETLTDSRNGPFSEALELQDLRTLLDNDIVPVHKEPIVDLVAAGYLVAGDKPEGLAFIDHDTLAVLNDNDFQLAGTVDPDTGFVSMLPTPVDPILGIIHLDQLLFDASNRDSREGDARINLAAWGGVVGAYQPDAIATFSIGKQTFIVSANEGDARDYGGYSEEARVDDLDLDPERFPRAFSAQQDANLGRLKTTTATGDTDADPEIEQIVAYGARSFSIWRENGELVYDSGDFIGRYLAENAPEGFNIDEDEVDGRSDDKGAEPEGVTIGKIGKQLFAFLVLERTNGIMIFDVTDPTAPIFQDHIVTAGDVSPEGVLFLDRRTSPTKSDALVVTNEVSGTTTLYEITRSPRAK